MTSNLFENKDRLRKVFQRLDAADESGRAVAFNLAGKALADAGVSWCDLLDAFTANSAASSTTDFMERRAAQQNVYNNQKGDLSDIFNGIFGETFSQPQRNQSTRPTNNQPFRDADWKHKVYLQGDQIPQTISGMVRILDERTTKVGKPMIIVQVETSRNIYGPIAIFGERDIETMKHANSLGVGVHGTVVHPDSDRYMPKFFGLTVMAAASNI